MKYYLIILSVMFSSIFLSAKGMIKGHQVDSNYIKAEDSLPDEKEKQNQEIDYYTWGGIHGYLSFKTAKNQKIKSYQHIIIALHSVFQVESVSPQLSGGSGITVAAMKEGYTAVLLPIFLGISSQSGKEQGVYGGIYYQVYPYMNAVKQENDLVLGDDDNKYSFGFGYKSFLLRAGVILNNLSLSVNYSYHNTKDFKTKFISFGVEGRNFLEKFLEKWGG